MSGPGERGPTGATGTAGEVAPLGTAPPPVTSRDTRAVPPSASGDTPAGASAAAAEASAPTTRRPAGAVEPAGDLPTQVARERPAGAAARRRDGDWARLQRDFARLRRVKGRGFWVSLADALLLDSGFQALVAHRLAHALARRGVPFLPAVCRRWAIGACGVDILPRADVGGGCIVAHGLGLVVGGYTVIGEDATLLHGVTFGEARFDEIDYPRVGDRVTVGAGATLLGGITVGDDAVIGAGAVVVADVPAGARVAGVPARVIGRAPAGGGDADDTATDGPTRGDT